MADRSLMLRAQKNEITEHHIYLVLAGKAKDTHNKTTLERIAADEHKHYCLLRAQTGVELEPNRLHIWWHVLLATLLGITFSLRHMEKGEDFAQKLYSKQKGKPFNELLKDEHRHEQALIDILKDPRIEYAGSIVLGLNDALVELTGALAGLSLALQNGRLIALTGGITGFAASLSMAASAYLSAKEDKTTGKDPMRGAIYTGITYLITVCLLIMPFLLINETFIALAITLSLAIGIIAFYTFYITTAKATSFWKQFLEMALISLGVAAISFGVGYLLKTVIGVDV